MTGKTSLVSVIIPAYNCAAVIERCAKSAINQSYKNIEIIIINDGSTDNTNGICKNLAKQYKQIKYFETKNQGVSAARNLGIKKSRGDYILFIDADDTIDKKFIEHCMETANANNVSVVYGEVDLIKNGNTIEKRKFPHKKSYLRDSGDIFLNCDWLFACPGALIKKTIIGETTFRTDMKYSEDAYFMFEIIADDEFCFDERAKYQYLYNPESATHQSMTEQGINKYISDIVILIDFMKKIIPDYGARFDELFYIRMNSACSIMLRSGYKYRDYARITKKHLKSFSGYNGKITGNRGRIQALKIKLLYRHHVLAHFILTWLGVKLKKNTYF